LRVNNTLAGVTGTAFADAGFIKSLALAAVERFNVSAGEAVSLSVLLPAEMQTELDKAFGASAKQTLDKGLEVRFDTSVKAGFKLAPKDGSYYLAFTEQDFLNLFKEYLRPKVRVLLFGE
jgi:V/A-type H+-transporting ATPase subunit E